MTKKEDIELYSDPDMVLKNAKKIYGKDVIIDLSTHKNKKYMIFDPYYYKWVHFGEMGYQDYTKHKDDNRRTLFKIRNYKWANYPMYTPSHMSYYLLW